MADGFLAPTGKFYPKTENFHAQTARAILGQDGQTDEPIQELLRRGYCRIPQTRRTGKSPCRYGLRPRRTGVSGDRRAEGLDCRTYGRAVEKAAVWHQQRRDKLWELLHQQCPHVSLVQRVCRRESAWPLGQCTERGEAEAVWCVSGLQEPSALTKNRKCQKIIWWDYNRKKKYFCTVMHQWGKSAEAA